MYRGRHRAGTLAAITSAIAVAAGSGVATADEAADDFAARCASPDVVKCVGFDDPADIAGDSQDNSGILSGASTPALDGSMKASGASSILFTIPTNSPADTSGSYFTNFSKDLSVQFGESAEFYVQWRQRFSVDFVTTDYPGGGGWKQVIIGSGDQPGQPYYSCTDLEVVTVNGYHHEFPSMYNSCSGSASHGAYDGFEEPFGAYDFKLQNARPDRSGGRTTWSGRRRSARAPEGPRLPITLPVNDRTRAEVRGHVGENVRARRRLGFIGLARHRAAS